MIQNLNRFSCQSPWTSLTGSFLQDHQKGDEEKRVHSTQSASPNAGEAYITGEGPKSVPLRGVVACLHPVNGKPKDPCKAPGPNRKQRLQGVRR